MTTKENFIKRYNVCKESVIMAMDETLNNAIENGVIKFEDLENNYLAVYPLIAAVLEREAYFCLEGGSDESVTRQMKRQCRKYRNDIRVWYKMA